jgi:hypothetical protein
MAVAEARERLRPRRSPGGAAVRATALDGQVLDIDVEPVPEEDLVRERLDLVPGELLPPAT